jgi:hypothetical protein
MIKIKKISIKDILQHEYFEVVAVIVGIKIVILIVSIVAFSLFAEVSKTQSLVEFVTSIWDRWDALFWYIRIAEWGYGSSGDGFLSIVFFPLFPALIRLTSLVVSNTALAAMLVSNAFSVAGLFVFYKLAKLEFGKKIAWHSLMMLMVFPSAYFFVAPYTESLFLLFSVSAFYSARRGKWFWAGLLGCMAALTRVMGVLLLPALLIEFYLQWRKKKSLWPNLLWLLLIPGGLFIYLRFNYELFGNYLAFMDFANGYWHKRFAWPWDSLVYLWRRVESFPFSGWNIMQVIVELIAAGVLIISTIVAFIRLRFSYTVYMFLVTFLVLSTSLLQSTPRYVLSVFPVFFLLGQLVKYRVLSVMWLAFSTSIMVLLMTHFVLGWSAF